MMFSNCSALSDCADFKAALLLGRANYLCPHRLKRALAEKRELFDTAESAELERIAQWALTTRTGLVDELNPPPNPEVWAWVNADASSCTPKIVRTAHASTKMRAARFHRQTWLS